MNTYKKTIIWLLLLIWITPVFASDRDLPGITIISRTEWGANESIRMASMSYAERKALQNSQSELEMKNLEETNFEKYIEKQKEEYENSMRNEYLMDNFSDEQKVNNVIYQYWDSYLKRPQSYHYQKTKIIVHHTAGNTSDFTGKESAINELKDIYMYHTKNRWWWDIGYNFIIDPYGNIYEWRAGGDSVIWAHASRNNTPSVGISLMGNFQEQKPTQQQIDSLITLITALAKKYNIDPTAKATYHKSITELPYMKSAEASTIAGHKDAGITSCPGKYVYELLPQIRTAVVQRLAKWVLVSYSQLVKITPTINQIKTTTSTTNISSAKEKWIALLKSRNPEFDKVTKSLQTAYKKKNNIKDATTSTKKISAKISKDQVKQYLESDISVLLYELSTQYSQRQIGCSSSCSFLTPSGTYTATSASIEINEWGLLLQINWEKYNETSIKVQAAKNELIEIKNYPRVSYFKIPWNTFYGSLTFGRGQLKNLKTGKFVNQNIIVNTLPFHQYLKWIVETNDSEHSEKIKVMNLISKMYAVFYKNEANRHPSIPVWASYTAIDNPEMFQKYVWAGVEKTLKTVPSLVDSQKTEIILYDNYVPILPYFNCSAWFTWSAKAKRWWNDTPYLVSRIDMDQCTSFNGHGVWLSGKWAQFFAKNGWNYKEILHYYYPGVQIISL